MLQILLDLNFVIFDFKKLSFKLRIDGLEVKTIDFEMSLTKKIQKHFDKPSYQTLPPVEEIQMNPFIGNLCITTKNSLKSRYVGPEEGIEINKCCKTKSFLMKW